MSFLEWFTGLFKPATKAVLPMSPEFPFEVCVDGNDLVCIGIATAFGGAYDRASLHGCKRILMDDGETASGVNTKRNPLIMGCALPMDGYDIRSLKGSPFPKMPFGLHHDGTINPDGAHVVLELPGDRVIGPMPVIDLGPSGGTGHAIDLTVATARMLDQHATASNFEQRVTFRVLGGAKYLAKA